MKRQRKRRTIRLSFFTCLRGVSSSALCERFAFVRPAIGAKEGIDMKESKVNEYDSCGTLLIL
jgi:hypothetical protein